MRFVINLMTAVIDLMTIHIHARERTGTSGAARRESLPFSWSEPHSSGRATDRDHQRDDQERSQNGQQNGQKGAPCLSHRPV